MYRALAAVTGLIVLFAVPAPAAGATALTTAEAWTALFQSKNDGEWSGADQATSVPASNGAVYWLFGDTMLGSEDPATGAYSAGARMIANTILVQRGGMFSPATPAGAPAIPNVPNPSPDAIPRNGDEDDRYWAQAAVEHAGYLNVFAQRVRARPGEAADFALVGAEIARFRISGDQLVFEGMVPTPSTGLGETVTPQWAGATVAHGGHAYVYGHRYAADPFNPHNSYLARVPLDALADPSAWRFWGASGWTSAATEAVPVSDSQAASAAIVNGRWTVLFKPWHGLGTAVLARTATDPYGPFTTREIFSAPAGTTSEGREYVTYAPMLHPEQPLDGGKVLVSIAWNGRDFWRDTLRDADLYKPRFHEVVL